MRLAALAESESHVCCRYRLTAFRGALARAGHTLDVHPLPQTLLTRFTFGRDLTSYDAVILQRKLLPRWVIARLRRRVRRLIFDFDDAVWLRDSHSPKGFDDPKRAARFRGTVEACDLIVAGNEYLAAESRKFVPTDRVRIIPTCVDVTKYPLQAPTPPSPPSLKGRGEEEIWPSPLAGEGRDPSPVGEAPTPSPARGEGKTTVSPFPSGRGGGGVGLCLVWVGSSSTLRGLERFAPTLSAIGLAVPGTRLKLVCDRFVEFPELPVERCVWNEATEAAEIAAADVGIGWVPDDPWSRGKCGLKVLQYQAAGLPVVANAVGVQADFVRHGTTGFRATTSDEWANAIRTLAADAALRKRLGDAGRRQVEKRYSVDAGAALWLESLASIAGDVRKTG